MCKIANMNISTDSKRAGIPVAISGYESFELALMILSHDDAIEIAVDCQKLRKMTPLMASTLSPGL